MALGLSLLFALVLGLALTDPQLVARLILPPTPTPIPPLPPTWTATRTPPPGPSPTASRTPTPTPTPAPSATPIPTLTFTPPATPPAGWVEIEFRAARFALQLPNTWLSTPLLGRDPAVALAELTQLDPRRGESLQDGLGLAVLDDLIMVGIDTATSTDPYVNNMHAATANPAHGATIDDILAVHLAAFGDEDSDYYEVIATDSTTVDGQPAHRIRYTTRFETAEGDRITVYHLEVIAEGRRERDPILIFTFSTSQGRRNIYESLYDRIVTTIRYLRVLPPTPTFTPSPTRDRTLTPDTPTPPVTATPGDTPSPTP